MKRYQYDRQGFLALNPRAFMGLFAPAGAPENETLDTATIVDVSGPLERQAGWFCDSYESIKERVGAACAAPAPIVVLRLDSPGGDASGCIETARELRDALAAAGKRSIAYVTGQACSAAYALALACDEIVVAATSFVGSIGIINARIDLSAADAAQGVRVALVMSGARKADGNPHLPLSEAELAETQATVDSLADLFFEFVSERRAVDARPLQARVFHGAKAVAAKLADRVVSYEAFLASLADAQNPQGEVGMSKYEEARAALAEAAKGDDEEAAKARAALAAMDGDEDDKKKDEEAARAEGDSDEDKDKKKDEEATRAAAAAAPFAAQVQTLAAQVRELTAKNENADRAAFMATRPDLAPELVKVLATKPLAEVKAIVGAIPAPVAPTQAQLTATASTVPATRGEGQGDPTPAPTPAFADMDARMGITKFGMGVVEKTPHAISFGVRAEKKPAQPAGKVA